MSREREVEPQRLGDVLYANRSGTVVVEQEWAVLVAAIAKGDQLALHALYERSHRLVFTLVMRITHSPHAAEELTVDVFHDVWRRACEYDPANGPVLGWIMNQARSRAIDRLRFEQRKKRSAPVSSEPVVPLHADSSLERLAAEQEGRRVREALTVLTPDEREAIEAAFFGGLTHAQVAERLDAPLGTIKTRIRSGLHKLRRALAAEVGEP
jgi:RNA polymerase sigma-70 factor (ECF subfamily)